MVPFDILGMPSESELSVTTHNDDLNVGVRSYTKICCVSCVGRGCFVSYLSLCNDLNTIDLALCILAYLCKFKLLLRQIGQLLLLHLFLHI